LTDLSFFINVFNAKLPVMNVVERTTDAISENNRITQIEIILKETVYV